jgi:multicomponent Na+:H+ antiporter subunit D
MRAAPWLAAMFLVSALGLAGIPPLSGFISKFALVAAGVAARQYAVVAVSLVVSLLTLFCMVRVWSAAFWSPGEALADRAQRDHPASPRSPVAMMAPTAALVACSLAVAAAAGPIYAFSERTARDLLDRSSYIGAVTRP